MSSNPRTVIDLSNNEESTAAAAVAPSATSAASPRPRIVLNSSYHPPSLVSPHASSSSTQSICPVCQITIEDAQFANHVSQCLGLDARNKQQQQAAVAAASTSMDTSDDPLSVQILAFQSFLATQSPRSLQQHAPQLQSLGQQLQQVLVPIATFGGVMNVPVRDNSTSPASVGSTPSSARGGQAAAAAAAESDTMMPAASDSSSSAAKRHVLTSRSFTPSVQNDGSYSTAFNSMSPTNNSGAPRLPTAASSSSSSSSSSVPMAASTAYGSSMESSYPSSSSSTSTGDTEMLSDEELVRRMLQEEEAQAERLRRERQAQAEREFEEFLKLEGTCAKCGSKEAEQLIQICDDAAKARTQGHPVCDHRICTNCLKEHLQSMVNKMKMNTSGANAAQLTESDLVCPFPSCASPLQQWQMRRVLSEDEFNQLLSHTFQNSLVMKSKSSGGSTSNSSSGSAGGSKFVKCPNATCHNVFEAVEGNSGSQALKASNTSEVGLDGQPMSASSRIHRAKYRFRCNACSTIFCGECSATPYHDGFNCAEFEKYRTAKKCRFCSTGLTPANTASKHGSDPIVGRAVAIVGGVVGSLAGFFGASSSNAASSTSSSSSAASNVPSTLADVCNSAECIEKRNNSCDKLLGCGHACCGIRGEKPCLVCLQEDCAAHTASRTDQNAEDFCNVCYIEGLGQAPSIQLNSCGHIFHLKCLTDKLNRKWPGARITFGFLNCPLCKVEMNHPALKQLMAPLLKLRAEVQVKATQRLAFEGLEHDEAFTSPKGKYYQMKDAYAMDRFAYYMCFKCKQPYFGGQRRCEEAAQQNGDEKFEAEHLVCGGCTAGSDAKNCSVHGKEFIEYKCKFCCNIATWYCWGTTHFCLNCHRRQENGDYVTRKPISELDKCPGPGKCPLGVRHPPNGNEFSLGCGICKPRDF